jgi:hypothetical protein
MTKREVGLYALLIGVLMFILIRAYTHYKAGFDWSQDWLTWTQDIAAVLAGIGLVLTWKELV